MAEQKKTTQETKEVEKTEEVKEEKEMAEKIEKTEEETEVKGKVKEPKEKPGFFKKVWNGVKRNKKIIIASIVSAAAGVGGTLGVEKLGEIAYERKHRNDQAIPMTYENNDDEILSPNVDD